MARRGSARCREQRRGEGLNQLPWRRLRNRYKPIEVLDKDGLEAIHDASMRILEEHGLESFEPPPLDPAIDAELTAYVAKRKEEIAATIRFSRRFHRSIEFVQPRDAARSALLQRDEATKLESVPNNNI